MIACVVVAVAFLCVGGPARAAQHLVFVRGRAEGPGSHDSVWSANLNGHDQRRLGSGQYFEISPGGRYVLVSNSDSAAPPSVIYPINGGRGIRVRAPASSSAQDLLGWAGDSSHLLFRDDGVNGGIDLVDWRTGVSSPLVTEPYLSFTVSPFRPFTLLYSAPDGPAPGIYVVRLDGKGRRRLDRQGVGEFPAWAGREVAFTRRGQIWLMHADGSHQRQLTHAHDATLMPGPLWGRQYMVVTKEDINTFVTYLVSMRNGSFHPLPGPRELLEGTDSRHMRLLVEYSRGIGIIGLHDREPKLILPDVNGAAWTLR